MALLETLGLEARDVVAVSVGLVGTALPAVVTVLAVEVGATVVEVRVVVGILVGIKDLLKAVDDVVVKLQVLGERLGSWLLRTK